MSNRGPFIGLECSYCLRAIPLPPATHPDMSVGLGSWPTDEAKRSFVCSRCKHVYEYSEMDVRQLSAGKDIRRENISYDVMSMWLQCGEQGCEAPLRVRIVAPSDTNADEMAMEVLQEAQAHAIHCDTGHILNGRVQPYGATLIVMFDEDWKASYMDYP